MKEWTKISELTSEEMLEELESRYDHLVFAATADAGNGLTRVIRTSKGSMHACMGLAQDLSHYNYHERMTESDDQATE